MLPLPNYSIFLTLLFLLFAKIFFLSLNLRTHITVIYEYSLDKLNQLMREGESVFIFPFPM